MPPSWRTDVIKEGRPEMGATTTTTESARAANALAKAEDAYRRAWAEERRAAALDEVRRSLPSLERAVERVRKEIGQWEAHLAKLKRMRAGFVEELQSLPRDTSSLTAHEEGQVRQRRRDLLDAVAALNGDDPRGTLVDHLAVEGRPRIPGTRRCIEDARELLAKAERELERAQRQLANA
jgi:chromosome segregation ATPase